MDRQPCVHILASDRNGTIYGVTSDLPKRLYQHRTGTPDGFTSRYGVAKLVRYELFGDMSMAIAREKQLKRWHRPWKINLIEQDDADWHDLRSAWASTLSEAACPAWWMLKRVQYDG